MRGSRLKPTDTERKQVKAMAGYGMPHEHIAALFRDGIDAETLKKHFKKELLTGKATAGMRIGKTLYDRATTGGDTTAAIWWSKAQMGWRDSTRVETTGADGGPVKTESTVTLAADLTDAELAAELAEYGIQPP